MDKIDKTIDSIYVNLTRLPVGNTIRTIIIGALQILYNVLALFFAPSEATSKSRKLNKNAIVTGGTSGIGKATVKMLLEEGFNVTLLARSSVNLETTLKDFAQYSKRLSIIDCDLMSISSIVDACKKIEGPIDVLLNNAGVFQNKFVASKDGYESQFAVSHLAHYCIFSELKSKINKRRTRIINISSCVQYAPTLIDYESFTNPSKFSMHGSYSVSKLCNVLFTEYLASQGYKTCSVHPGAVMSNLYRSDRIVDFVLSKIVGSVIPILLITPEESAKHIFPLCASNSALNGEYFWNGKIRPSNRLVSLEKAKELVSYSESLLSKHN